MSSAEDSASCSSATWSQGPGGEIMVMDDVSIQSDQDLQDVVERFEMSVSLDPDRDISVGDSESNASNSIAKDTDLDSLGAASNASSVKDNTEEKVSEDDADDDNDDKPSANGTACEKGAEGGNTTGGVETEQKKSKKAEKTSSSSKDVKKKKSPLDLLRRLTKFDKSKDKPKQLYSSEFAQVKVDRLPQIFVAKYLGKREAKGVYGLHHVRKPVDEMVNKVKKGLEATDKMELPLVYLVVTPKGIDIREHKLNKVNEQATYGMIPIDFVSYGVQDIKYWRVFTFIVVNELSSRSKATECHAYLCDSSLNARKMALALGAAFKLYSRRLHTEGKPHNFQVELRPPDELADAYSKECEA